MTTAEAGPTDAALAVFEQAFGASWRRGPIPTALDVLEQDLRRFGAWQAPRLPEPAIIGGTEVPLLWTRPLTDEECTRARVVGFDKQSAYLAVLGGLELGIGSPQHCLAPIGGTLEPMMSWPGYWRVRAMYPPPVADFPDPLGRPRRLDTFWITTPTLELALEARIEVDVFESWTWPVHKRVLRPFGERCTGARRQLAEAAASTFALEDGSAERQEAIRAAQRMLKWTYAPILGGFLARLSDRAREHRPPWYRPDWRHHIIAKARANLWRSMAHWRARGGEPIGVYNDAVYFATDLSAAQLAEQLGVALTLSGGFSLGGERRLGDVVANGRLNWVSLLRG